MITVLVAAKRLPHLTLKEFTDYWLNVHAPLVKGVPEFAARLRRYVIYPLAQGADLNAPVLGRIPGYDGIGELRFDSVQAMNDAFNEAKYLEIIRPDEDKFLDRENCLTFITEEHIQLPGVA
jgi:uncharacterized protein (TIGR02118 family)